MRTPYVMTRYFHACGSNLLRSIFVFTFALLAACGSDGDGTPTVNSDPAPVVNPPVVNPPVVNTVQISGLAVDGPLRDATVVVFEADGDQVGQTTTDAAGRFVVEIPVTALYPLTVRVTGGTDTVSNAPASIELAGIITSSGQSMLLTPFSTLAVRRAECVASNAGTDQRAARNALTNADVDTLLGTALSFGLHSAVRSQLLSVIPTDPAQAASLLLSSEQMGEVLRRVSQELTVTPNQVLTEIACDLANGALDGTEVGSSTRVAALFQLVSAEVMLEAASGNLRVGGVPATTALIDALSSTFGISNVNTASLTLDQDTLNRLRKLVYAALVANPGSDLLGLFDALAGLSAPLAPADLDAVLDTLTEPAPLRVVIEAVTPSSVQLLLSALEAPVVPVPIINFLTATPAPGGLSTLTWSTQNASVCERSGPGLGWNGLGDASGSVNAGPIVNNVTFTLTCASSGGVVTASVDVVVPPSANISLSPEIANLGETVVIEFVSFNADSCTSTRTDGNGNEAVFVSGATIVANVGVNINVTCSGPGGTVITLRSLPVRAARLTWEAPTLTEDGSAVSLQGFKVYHGTTSGSRSGLIVINDPTARELTADLAAFPSGTRFFEITAIASGDLESRFSNEVSKLIP